MKNNSLLTLKSYLLTLICTYLVSYVFSFICIGILWDPNGVNLFERGTAEALKILFIGLIVTLPAGVQILLNEGMPLIVLISLILFSVLFLILGRYYRFPRFLAYVIIFLWVSFGTLYFCLLA